MGDIFFFLSCVVVRLTLTKNPPHYRFPALTKSGVAPAAKFIGPDDRAGIPDLHITEIRVTHGSSIRPLTVRKWAPRAGKEDFVRLHTVHGDPHMGRFVDGLVPLLEGLWGGDGVFGDLVRIVGAG